MSLHPAALEPERLLRECETKRTRGGGPGGQHRNKVETAIVITHTPTGVVGQASERRSQEQNRKAALFRLRVNLALQVRGALDETAAPSKAWRARTRGGRISITPTHDDFPALLAEACDALHAADYDLRAASQRLGLSTSQLSKFLKLDSRAFQHINQQRRALGLHPMR